MFMQHGSIVKITCVEHFIVMHSTTFKDAYLKHLVLPKVLHVILISITVAILLVAVLQCCSACTHVIMAMPMFNVVQLVSVATSVDVLSMLDCALVLQISNCNEQMIWYVLAVH